MALCTVVRRGAPRTATGMGPRGAAVDGPWIYGSPNRAPLDAEVGSSWGSLKVHERKKPERMGWVQGWQFADHTCNNWGKSPRNYRGAGQPWKQARVNLEPFPFRFYCGMRSEFARKVWEQDPGGTGGRIRALVLGRALPFSKTTNSIEAGDVGQTLWHCREPTISASFSSSSLPCSMLHGIATDHRSPSDRRLPFTHLATKRTSTAPSVHYRRLYCVDSQL